MVRLKLLILIKIAALWVKAIFYFCFKVIEVTQALFYVLFYQRYLSLMTMKMLF